MWHTSLSTPEVLLIIIMICTHHFLACSVFMTALSGVNKSRIAVPFLLLRSCCAVVPCGGAQKPNTHARGNATPPARITSSINRVYRLAAESNIALFFQLVSVIAAFNNYECR